MDKLWRSALRATTLVAIVSVFSMVPEKAAAQASVSTRTGSGSSAVAPSFAGSADLSDATVGRLFVGFGLTKGDFACGRDTSNSVGFIVYDRAAGRIMRSYNPDRSFNLASTTKLFTMAVAGQLFAGDPMLSQHRAELSDILRASDNRGASLWLRLAQQKANGATRQLCSHEPESTGSLLRQSCKIERGEDG